MKISVSRVMADSFFKGASLTILFALYLVMATVCRAEEPISMVFGGDVMLARGVAKQVASAGQGDYRYPWVNIAGYFNQADITFINLESLITDKGTLNTLKSAPWLRAKPEAMNGLLYAGVDIVNVANNHAFDFGRTGFEDCLSRLRASGISYIGGGRAYDEAYSPLFVTVKGKKIAFLGYMSVLYSNWTATKPYTLYGIKIPGRSGIAWLSENALRQGIAKAKAGGANLIVVSMHWGDEYLSRANSFQQKYGRMALDLGADIVVGHHSHVLQPLEVYTGKRIYYSLGNLIFDQTESSQTGVTRGGVINVICGDTGITAVNERYIRINATTFQPSFE